MKKNVAIIASALLLPSLCQAELTALDDHSMEKASAQSGITIELAANISVGSIAYIDTDGHHTSSATAGRLTLNDVVIGGTDGGALDNLKIDIDVDTNTGLVVHVGSTNTTAVYRGAAERLDFGLAIGDVMINDNLVLASDISISGNLGPTDLTVHNNGTLTLDSYFEVTSASLDVDVIGLGIDNLTIGDNSSPILTGKYSGDISDYQAYILANLDDETFEYLETTYATEVSEAQDAALADNADDINAIGDQAVVDNQATITASGISAVNSTQGQTTITTAGNTAVTNNAAVITGAGDTAVITNTGVITTAGNTAVIDNSAVIINAGDTAVSSNTAVITNAGNTAVSNNATIITAAGDTAIANNATVITASGNTAVVDGEDDINQAGTFAFWVSLFNGDGFTGALAARDVAIEEKTQEIRTDAEAETAAPIRAIAETAISEPIRTDAENTTSTQIRTDAELATETTIRNDAETTTEAGIRDNAEAVTENTIRDDAETSAEAGVKDDAEEVAETTIRDEATSDLIAQIRKQTKTTVLTEYAQTDSLNGVSGMGFVSFSIGTEDTTYFDPATSQTVNVSDALRIDINSMNLDISADLSMGQNNGVPSQLGSMAIDGLDLSGSSITIYGL
jgi:hypothetical protein